MGFWARLFGREVDTSVIDYQAKVADAARAVPVRQQRATQGAAAFRMTVEDVFHITGRGTVVTGKVEHGQVGTGDVLEWMHPDGRSLNATVSGFEAFRRTLTTAVAGEHVGILLGPTPREDVPAGTVLSRS